MIRTLHIRQLCAAAVLLVTVAACGDDSTTGDDGVTADTPAAGDTLPADALLAEGGDIVYLSPWNYDRVDLEHTDEPPLVVSPDRREDFSQQFGEYRQLVDEFAAHSDDVLHRPDLVEGAGLMMLGPLEEAFLRTGRYLELIELYRRHYAEHGVDSLSAVALGWALVRIGHRPAARTIIDELTHQRADDPLTWVVVGEYHARLADRSARAAHQAKEAYERVFELQPDFPGFKILSDRQLRDKLELMRQLAPDELPEQPDEQRDDVDIDIDDRAPHRDRARRIGANVTTDAEQLAESLAITPREYVQQAFPDDLPPDQIAEQLQRRDESQPADDHDPGPGDEETDADEPPRVDHHITHGRRALQRGSEHDLREAQQHFEQALEHDPENADAAIGLLRIAERTGAPESMMTEQLDTLAEHDLTARQAYELGLFSLRRLNDPDRATSLLERVEQLDSSFARRVGVDELLEQH